MPVRALSTCRATAVRAGWRPRTRSPPSPRRSRSASRRSRPTSPSPTTACSCSPTTPCSIPTSCAAPTANGCAARARHQHADAGGDQALRRWPARPVEQVCAAVSRPEARRRRAHSDARRALRRSPSAPARRRASTSRPSCRPRSLDETPDPETFARLVVEAVRGAGLTRRTTIQSFDWRTLLAVKKLAPEIETVCLTYAQTLEDRTRGRRPPSLALARRPRSGCPWRVGAALVAGGRLRHLVAALPRAERRRRDGSACARPEGRAVDGQRRRGHGSASST